MALPRDVEEAKKVLLEKARTVSDLLQTTGGQALLEIIELQFCSDHNGVKLLADTPHKMAYNIGAYDVVLYLRQLQRVHNKRSAIIDPLT